jgi:hypothetical protein
VSSNTQLVLGRLPITVSQADVVREMVAKFREQAKLCSCLETSSSRVCDLLHGLTDDRVYLAVCLEEAAR